MKKIFAYITVALAGLLTLASCSKNEPPVFDDANAFVAFNKEKMAVAESVLQDDGTYSAKGDTLKIPVTLASVKGLEASVTYTVQDGSALLGTDFSVVSGETLEFDAENRTAYIMIVPNYNEEYTGDKKFSVSINRPETLNLGAASVCTVTISDVNHPMAAFLGTYTMTGDNMDCADDPWMITVDKDDSDDHVLWFDNLFGYTGWCGDDMIFYGVVDNELLTITFPLGQKTEYEYSPGSPFVLYGFDADGWNSYMTEDEFYGSDSGSVVADILYNEDGSVKGIDFGQNGLNTAIKGLGGLGAFGPGTIALKD